MNWSVYERFMDRWTQREAIRLREIERNNTIDRCPFVDALRSYRPAGYLEPLQEFRDSDAWLDTSPYVGGPRYSLKTRDTFVGTVIEDSVSGELEIRSFREPDQEIA